jgi:hypothetical protein
MSKDSVIYLKGEIKTESEFAYSASEDLKFLSNSIMNAINDRVGESAVKSLAGIRNSFDLDADDGYKSMKNATYAMEKGYSDIEALLSEAEKLMERARAIFKDVGDI